MNKILNIIDKFEIELLEIMDDCMSDWSYIEKQYHEKFKELKDALYTEGEQDGK